MIQKRPERVIQNARAVNMPKDKVESAIRRASGKDAANYEQVIYEGYAPHGVAVLVEAATDNTTRTVASLPLYWVLDQANRKVFNEVFYRAYRGITQDRLLVLAQELFEEVPMELCRYAVKLPDGAFRFSRFCCAANMMPCLDCV